MWTSLLEVRVDDYHKQEGRVPYLNEARFKRKIRKWYNLTEEQAEKQWQDALRDKTVPKGRDDFGGVTVAKLKTDEYSGGRQVNTGRELRESGTHVVENPADIAALGRG